MDFPEGLLMLIPEGDRDAVIGILEGDPRPQYKADGEHIYGMKYGELEIFFKVSGGVLTVTEVKAP